MIRRGEVGEVRELSGPKGRRVQARVCLGASTQHGSATVTVESKSPAVLDALDALKKALAKDAFDMTLEIMADAETWMTDGRPKTRVEVSA